MEQRAEHRDKPLSNAAFNMVAPLFVPGNRPDRVRKAREKGARLVILDLEDAVPLSEKVGARNGVISGLSEPFPGGHHFVRVNSATAGTLLNDDIAALVPVLDRVDGIILAKASSADEVVALHDRLTREGHHIPLIPTIETAAAVRDSWSIAGAPGVLTILFGSADLGAELGVEPSPVGTELETARSMIVLASAAAGLARPIDGPYLNLRDLDALATSTRSARRLGFGGKIVLHPAQLAVVTSVFAPTPVEVEWARDVITAYDRALAAGIGVVQLDDGTFIDPPIAARAQRILTTAKEM